MGIRYRYMSCKNINPATIVILLRMLILIYRTIKLNNIGTINNQRIALSSKLIDYRNILYYTVPTA